MNQSTFYQSALILFSTLLACKKKKRRGDMLWCLGGEMGGAWNVHYQAHCWHVWNFQTIKDSLLFKSCWLIILSLSIISFQFSWHSHLPLPSKLQCFLTLGFAQTIWAIDRQCVLFCLLSVSSSCLPSTFYTILGWPIFRLLSSNCWDY